MSGKSIEKTYQKKT
jgi:DNA topoisomerase II